ncbi:hypothetical protein AVEN_31353-1 [Araneus ventricosus]|uniref:Uncharacterized protein n=1 Tax=Araneus ventricosus TaxID=182803 RepID=A0A4Y2F963_ARAVE|nr:hypothetical protein AVEN_31353-1 [Araneus ventricosus]
MEKLVNSLASEQNSPQRNPKVTCWKCFKKGYVQRESQSKYINPEKLTCGRLTELRVTSLNKALEKGLKASALSGGGNGLYLEASIQHLKGTSHGNAVAVSPRSCTESSKHCSNAEKKFGMKIDISAKALAMTTEDSWSSSEIQKAQLEEPDIRPILKKKLNSTGRQSWQEFAWDSPATK